MGKSYDRKNAKNIGDVTTCHVKLHAGKLD